jgi:hypothetical protein
MVQICIQMNVNGNKWYLLKLSQMGGGIKENGGGGEFKYDIFDML